MKTRHRNRGLQRFASRKFRPAFEHLEDRVTPATLIVNNPTDTAVEGKMSLREAIAAANIDAAAGISDSIVFDAALGTQTIGLTQGQLVLSGAGGTITLDGGGRITVSGQNASRVFRVESGVTAVLTNLQITAGDAGSSSGGGIRNFGALTVTNSKLLGNRGAGAGAIENNAVLTVIDSTLSGNSVSETGGAFFNGGEATFSGCTFVDNSAAFHGGAGGNSGLLSIINSTFTGNSAAFDGGAIDDFGPVLYVSHSTFAGNSAGERGGAFAHSGFLSLQCTIIAGNSAPTGPDIITLGGSNVRGNYNLVGDGSGMSGLHIEFDVGNQIGTSAAPIDPRLAPLADNGGPTQTMALLESSPAIAQGGRVTRVRGNISGITATATTFEVEEASSIASTPGAYVIRVDDEEMLVIDAQHFGNALTVQRGYNGTTAAPHSFGAAVYLAMDQSGHARGTPPDIGAFAFRIVVGPLPDLTAPSITVAPSSNLLFGQTVTVTWTVQNTGQGAATGDWEDAVYLSPTPTLSADAIRLAVVPHTEDLAAGGTYSANATVELPGILPAYVVVKTDHRGQLAESDNVNNVGATLLSIDAQQLTLGAPFSGQLAEGESAYFRVDVPANEAVRIDFASASSTTSTELYVRSNLMPTRTKYDLAQTAPFQQGQSLVIPLAPEPRVIYVLVYGANVPGDPAGFTLTASTLDFTVLDQHYGQGGTAGSITLGINGAKFDRTVTARLHNDAGVDLPAKAYYFVDQSQFFATFDLTQVSPGDYDVVVTHGAGGIAVVSDGLQVVAGGGGTNEPVLDAPEIVGRNRNYRFSVRWTNTGINDANVPLLRVIQTVPFGFRIGDTSAGSAQARLPRPDHPASEIA